MKKRMHQSQGFTLIEIIVSIVVFMTAVVGLVALQAVSIAGGQQGQKHTAAVNIARFVLAQLKTETSNWRAWGSGSAPAACDGSTFAQLPLLSQAFTANCTVGQWIELDADNNADLRLDPFLGHSAMNAGANSDSSLYCVHYRVDPIPALAAGDNILTRTLFQVRVRVIWPKAGQYGGGISGVTWTSCLPTNYSGGGNRETVSDYVELVDIASREFAQ